jgi:hypothetical protein
VVFASVILVTLLVKTTTSKRKRLTVRIIVGEIVPAYSKNLESGFIQRFLYR